LGLTEPQHEITAPSPQRVLGRLPSPPAGAELALPVWARFRRRGGLVARAYWYSARRPRPGSEGALTHRRL